MSNLLEKPVSDIVAICDKVFSYTRVTEDGKYFSFFNENEIVEMKKRIQEFSSNPKSRSGGSYILKELKLVLNFKQGLYEHVENIKDALKPRERRESVAEMLNKHDQKIIENVTLSFKALDERTLRSIARVALGDDEENYTRDELPKVLAYKQVTGRVLSPME